MHQPHSLLTTLPPHLLQRLQQVQHLPPTAQRRLQRRFRPLPRNLGFCRSRPLLFPFRSRYLDPSLPLQHKSDSLHRHRPRILLHRLPNHILHNRANPSLPAPHLFQAAPGPSNRQPRSQMQSPQRIRFCYRRRSPRAGAGGAADPQGGRRKGYFLRSR